VDDTAAQRDSRTALLQVSKMVNIPNIVIVLIFLPHIQVKQTKNSFLGTENFQKYPTELPLTLTST